MNVICVYHKENKSHTNNEMEIKWCKENINMHINFMSIFEGFVYHVDMGFRIRLKI